MKNVKMLKTMISSGANNLYNNYPYIDKLNVFPVPDGDTGTNMNLTLTNAYSEINKSEFKDFRQLMQKFSRGLIMGARGNSGVIFSQIMKGFSKGMENAEDLDVATWKKCFSQAQEVAYSAVMKPVEGTILTVIRETSEAVQKLDDSISEKDFWNVVIEAATVSLNNTPNLLQALKDVGVVDSGGYGLLKFLEGMQSVIVKDKTISRKKKLETNEGGNLDLDIEDSEFGYCTEAVVMLTSDWISKMKVDSVRQQLSEYGNNSIVAVKDEDILKIHTHALNPGQVLTFLQQFGDFNSIKVDNMSLQADRQVKGAKPVSHTQIKNKRNLVNEFATIAVVPSDGISKYFKKELNVDFVINGGSKMNPSTTDFMKAIESVDAKNVFILPNNSNVIMAAKQAKELEKKSKVFVIPTKTIPQGMVAFLNYDPSETPRKNESNLNRVSKEVISFSISTASRDSLVDNIKIKEGQKLGMIDGKIVFAGESTRTVFEKVLGKNITNKTEILTIFSGTDASANDINDLRKFLDENFDVEYEIVEGGQEIYDFIIGIE
ncbi:dihydroxyacetone/glyceraldehyde kinase [Spiroplasma sabaudiense Ar-1343]|uniref:Dihydroxyacetone/glyceraldehyde kinase n=1 Tax=Spiroplasma sabaudiense Ar-1343 TaxID=1276257 RepID=W6AAL4_9MOLU|nr:DAK2 domain-containing protein [Spiroplasma sabaudiense]AHI54056.1 dihydroxyacetone/glyceraldehyde kinase [Spiroplasma sabaudiense Ar-1343]